MRYYIRLGGRLSSITISDTLSQWLVIACGGVTDRAKRDKKKAQAWISTLADRPDVPDRDVSQWVQARIVDYIVNPALRERLQERQNAAKLKKEALQKAAEAYRATGLPK